jgi:hypothetical protein
MVFFQESLPGRLAFSSRNAGVEPENPEVPLKFRRDRDSSRFRFSVGRRGSFLLVACGASFSVVRFPAFKRVLVGIESIAKYVTKTVVVTFHKKAPFGNYTSKKQKKTSFFLAMSIAVR